MGFLVGNDFLPTLPNFHVKKRALPFLFSSYIEVLPTLDGYINENGQLHLLRFEKFIKQVSLIDYEIFNDANADVKLQSRNCLRKLVEVVASCINFSIFDSNTIFYVFSANMSKENRC